MAETETLNLGTYRAVLGGKTHVEQKALLPAHHLVTHACILGMTMIATLCGTFLTLRNRSHTVCVREAHGLEVSTENAAAGGSYGFAVTFARGCDA
jgi:hypothetical protein